MRDPRDALVGFFFGQRFVGVLMACAMLGAGAVALAGCEPAPAPVQPEALGRAASTAAGPGAIRVFKVRFPAGQEDDFYILTQPETGCEYLMSGNYDLTPNMGRTNTGAFLQMGCRLGSYEAHQP